MSLIKRPNSNNWYYLFQIQGRKYFGATQTPQKALVPSSGGGCSSEPQYGDVPGLSVRSVIVSRMAIERIAALGRSCASGRQAILTP
jgi:hypothetical protein